MTVRAPLFICRGFAGPPEWDWVVRYSESIRGLRHGKIGEPFDLRNPNLRSELAVIIVHDERPGSCDLEARPQELQGFED